VIVFQKSGVAVDLRMVSLANDGFCKVPRGLDVPGSREPTRADYILGQRVPTSELMIS
jgi:hypothetical protein